MPIDPLGIESGSSIATNDPLGIEKGSVQTLNRTPEWAKKRAGLVAEQEQLRSDPRGPLLVNAFNFLSRIAEPLTPHGLLSQPNRLLGMQDPNTQINPNLQGLVQGGLQELENRGFVPPGTLAQPDSPVLGVAQAIARPADEMLNPETALVAPALMEDAGAQQLQQVLKSLFAGQIGSQIPGQVSQGQQVALDPNAPLSEKVAASGSPVVNAFMAGLIARDAMEKGPRPELEGVKGILQRSGPGEFRQGDPALPFIARAGTRFTVSESGRTLDAQDPLGIESEGVKRASQQSPVVIGEQPQGTQIITPEMLRQSPTTVQPITTPQPPVEPSGGEVSFRGQGIPSAGQSATLPQAQPPTPAPVSPELIQRIYPRSTPGLGGTVNITQPETGFTVEGFRPPDVKGANERLQSKFADDLVPGIKDTGKGNIKAENMNQITHDDVLRANGMDPDSIPHFDSRRGFFDSFGRFYTRKEAERLTGIKGTARAGGLDSMDLPRSKKGAQDASRELRPDSISQTQPPGNIQEVGKEVRPGAGSQGVTQETKGGEEVSGKEKVQEKEDGGLHGAGETVLGEEGKEPPPENPSANLMGGFSLLSPDFWKASFGKEARENIKMDATQLYNKIRNLVGKDSGTWKALDTEEFRRFMTGGGRRSPDEVKEWMEKNGPKVEVRKFGEKKFTENAKVHAEMVHSFYDKLPREVKNSVDRAVSEANRNGKDRNADYVSWVEQSVDDWISSYERRDMSIPEKPSEFRKKLDKFIDASVGVLQEPVQQGAHWSSIAPKPESEMPGYTEIAVVKPPKEVMPPDSHDEYVPGKGWALIQNRSNVPVTKFFDTRDELFDTYKSQFPSSHSFPPNTLGFVRGYMETTPEGKKVFHVIEVQSDWAQNNRRIMEDPHSMVNRGRSTLSQEPLLSQYERLALKAAIDHARSEGADAIAISDAETAMMTEGHDRNLIGRNYFDSRREAVAYARARGINEAMVIESVDRPGEWVVGDTSDKVISQEPGMRLHYDRTLPKIAEELTGEKGQRVEFGPHRMAFLQPREYDNAGGLVDTGGAARKDLIFRDPSGQPKTSITARQFNIGKAKEDFSLYGSDKPAKTAVSETPSRPGTKLYGGLPIFDPDLWLTTAEDLKRMKDKFSAYLAKKGIPEEIGKTVDSIRKSKIITTQTAQQVLNNPNAKKFETLGKRFQQPGEGVSVLDAAHNALTPIINTASETDKVLNPWDVIFDWLDGGKAEFKGPLVQNIRIPFDEKFQQEGNMQEALTTPLKDIVKKNKLTPKNEQRIAIYLHSLQEGGRERMIASGVRSDVIDNILRTLTPAEKKYADAWRKIDDQLYPLLRDVAAKTDKVKVKQVANHFPWSRDFNKYQPEVDEIATNPNLSPGKEVDPGDVIWPGLPVDYGARKTPGSLISRQRGAKTPIRFDTFSIADRYIRDAVHYITSRELVKDTGSLVRSEDFANKYGDLGQKLMVEFINTYARQGRYKKNIWIDTIKRNLGRAIIGGRIPSQFLHTANIPLAIKQAGAVWWERGLQEALSDRGQEFINKHFIETKMRGGGEPVQAEIAAQQARTLIGKRFNDLSRWSFSVQRAIDQYNAQATTLGVYMRLLKENGKDPSNYSELPVDNKLIGEARIRARRAVASPIYKDVPPIVARGGSLGRAFFQFQNVFLDQYSNLRYEAAQVGLPKALRGSPKELMVTTAALMGMLMIETGIKHAYKQAVNTKKDDKFDQELAQEALKRIPGMGQLQASVLYGESGVPSLDVPVDVARQGKRIVTGDRSQRTMATLRGATDVAELAGIPGTSQVGDIASSLARKQLYKTHEQRVSELAGEDVSKGTLQERVRAERNYKKQQESQPQDREEQARAAERSISNITKRGSDLQKELDKSTQQWMEGRGLSLPGFDNKLKISGVDVYLTDKETERLGELVKEEYIKRINQLKLQKATINKDIFNEQMTFARATARSRMRNEMEKEKSRSNNEQDEKKGFSILPRN